MTRRFTTTGLTASFSLLLAFGACDDGGGMATDTGQTDSAVPSDLAETSSDMAVPDSGDGVSNEVTTILFEPMSSLDGRSSFFDLPYPLDARREADGTHDFSAFPGRVTSEVAATLMDSAERHRNFARLAVANFRFTAPVAELLESEIIPASTDEAFHLLDVDPDSPELGRLYPVVAATIDNDSFTPTNTIGVGVVPGFVLQPDTTYAFVVRTSLLDAAGEPVGVDPDFASLAAGETPPGDLGAALVENFAPLWPTLATAGIDAEEVASAAVFTTGNLVAETFELSQRVVDSYDITLDNLTMVAEWDRMCQLNGTMDLPQFQVGTPPFNTDGHFEFDANGAVIEQRTETIPFVLSIPRAPMPADGYPLALYFHGSGGIATQLIDRGPVTTAGGANTPGQGPAYVVAEHGIAMAGSAHPLSPDRFPGASDIQYVNFLNLGVLDGNFRQGSIEQRLYLEALLALRIDPAVLATCNGPTLPAGETEYFFRQDRVVAMGQSMGGLYANTIAAIEPKIEAVAPTGAGGHWTWFLTHTDLLDGKSALQVAINIDQPSFLHPLLAIAALAVEGGDPFVYVPHVARSPLPGHPARSIYQPAGQGDVYFPTLIYDAMALNYGHPQVGDDIWPTMQPHLELGGHNGFIDYDVTSNLTSDDGQTYTGAVVQYTDDGLQNAHYIYVQREEVRYQYGCFLATYIERGVATIPAPAPLGTPCP